MSRRAVFDIGTNTVRVLVVDDSAVVLRAHRVVTLGEGVDATGRFAEAAIVRAVDGLTELRALAGDAHVVDAVATSAARDAANRHEFLDRAAVVLGLRPRVISGEEEARLSFLGATGGGDDTERMVVDIGGGSTEMVVGRHAPASAVSFDVGSVRLTERVLAARPASASEVDVALAWVAERFADAPVGVPGIGVGGTFTSLAAIDAGLDTYDPAVVQGWELRRDRLEDVLAWMRTRTVAETAAIPSLDPARAPVLLAGTVVALGVLRACDLDAIEVRETDLLDALVGGTLCARPGGQTGRGGGLKNL